MNLKFNNVYNKFNIVNTFYQLGCDVVEPTLDISIKDIENEYYINFNFNFIDYDLKLGSHDNVNEQFSFKLDDINPSSLLILSNYNQNIGYRFTTQLIKLINKGVKNISDTIDNFGKMRELVALPNNNHTTTLNLMLVGIIGIISIYDDMSLLPQLKKFDVSQQKTILMSYENEILKQINKLFIGDSIDVDEINNFMTQFTTKLYG